MTERESKTLQTVVWTGGLALCLAAGGIVWPDALRVTGFSERFPGGSGDIRFPLAELMKLVIAMLFGIMVTTVHRHYHSESGLDSFLEQTMILLTVAGALMMIVIGDSIARAFGIGGAAAIIRFRTPVDNPKDAIVLFLLLAIGMACGLAAFGMAALASLFLCVALLWLNRAVEQRNRHVTVEVGAGSPIFPEQYVRSVLNYYALRVETREMSMDDEPKVKYKLLLRPDIPLDDISRRLMNCPDRGVKSVQWSKTKKGDKSD